MNAIATAPARKSILDASEAALARSGSLQSSDVRNANRALREGHRAYAAARTAWDAIHLANNDTVEGDRSEMHLAAAKAANALRASADAFYGIASDHACGEYAVTSSGEVLEVLATTSGSDYLEHVARWTGEDFWPTGEWPLSDVIVFVATPREAMEHRAFIRG